MESEASQRPALSPELSGELAPSTVIPAGQRSSQIVRAWMTANAGPTFHFDAEMREYFAASDGTQTMQDALDHWLTEWREYRALPVDERIGLEHGGDMRPGC